MDDEIYVKFDFLQIPGKIFYVAKNRGLVANKYTYLVQDKFAKMLMIWQAICGRGSKSKIFVATSTINSKYYIDECLENKLLQLIQLHNVPAWFWLDLASLYYSEPIQDWYKVNNVDVVPKDMNPPNCPQFRPIEKYWAIVRES